MSWDLNPVSLAQALLPLSFLGSIFSMEGEIALKGRIYMTIRASLDGAYLAAGLSQLLEKSGFYTGVPLHAFRG